MNPGSARTTRPPQRSQPACAILLTLAAVIASSCSARTGSDAGTARPPARPELIPAGLDQVREAIARPGASSVVVNVWATWCIPCREEFPDLVRIHRTYAPQGVRLVLISADFEDQAEDARRFLAEQGVDFPTFLKTGNDQVFIEGMDPRWTGALPATFVYAGSGPLRYFHEGRTTYAALEPQVLLAMGDTTSISKEPAP